MSVTHLIHMHVLYFGNTPDHKYNKLLASNYCVLRQMLYNYIYAASSTSGDSIVMRLMFSKRLLKPVILCIHEIRCLFCTPVWCVVYICLLLLWWWWWLLLLLILLLLY